MELETALRAGAPVVVVVAVDDAWGMEKTAYNFAGFGPEHHGAVEFAPGVRYDLLAQSLGCFGAKVDAIEQLGARLAGRGAVRQAGRDPRGRGRRRQRRSDWLQGVPLRADAVT